MELLDHIIVLSSVLWETSKLFSTVATLIYIPTKSVLGFPFLHILLNILCVLCDDSHSNSQTHGFDLHFPDDYWCWASFMCLIAICMSSLKNVYSVLLIFESHRFRMLSCMSCLYMLDINPLLVLTFANIFSHSVGCVFVLFMVSFAVEKLVSLIRSHLFIFAFISLT